MICGVQAAHKENEALQKEVADLKDELLRTDKHASFLSGSLHKVSWVRQKRALCISGLNL